MTQTQAGPGVPASQRSRGTAGAFPRGPRYHDAVTGVSPGSVVPSRLPDGLPAPAPLVAAAPAADVRGRGGDLVRRAAAGGADLLPGRAPGPAGRRSGSGRDGRGGGGPRAARGGRDRGPAGALRPGGRFELVLDGRRITDTVFEWHPEVPPAPWIDRREIVWAGWL